MTKAIFFSFILSLLSLLIVASPLQAPIKESGMMSSPYWNEIEELSLKAKQGMTLKEYENYNELLDKNEKWHEQRSKDFFANNPVTLESALVAWKKKSSFLAPYIMFMWGVLFNFYYRRNPVNRALFVLTIPILLIGTLMSLLEVALIVFIVLLVYFYYLIRGLPTEKS